MVCNISINLGEGRIYPADLEGRVHLGPTLSQDHQFRPTLPRDMAAGLLEGMRGGVRWMNSTVTLIGPHTSQTSLLLGGIAR